MPGAHLVTFLWLRWRLSVNQLIRGGPLASFLTVLLGVAAGVAGCASFAGGLLTGQFALGPDQASPAMVHLAWAFATGIFLFAWMIGVLVELQRAESLDPSRWLHLPIPAGQLFFLNYLASHVSWVLLVTMPGLLGLALGVTLSRGPEMLPLVPLTLATVFPVTAWTHWLRGRLAALVSDPRRRRSVILGITLAVILVSQAPYVILTVSTAMTEPAATKAEAEAVPGTTPDPAGEPEPDRDPFAPWRRVQRFVPPLWLALGARGLAEGHPGPAWWGTLGGCLLGALGLHRAYRATVRLHRGTTARRRPAPESSSVPASGSLRPGLLERRLPGVPEPAAAIALATFRSLSRSPEMKLSLGTSLLLSLLLAGTFLFPLRGTVPLPLRPFVVTGVLVLTILMQLPLLANQFGLDRDGFRTYVLAPTDRRWILLGKNLALVPACAGSGAFLLAVIGWWMGLPPGAIAAAALQLTVLLQLAILGGNLLSILVPYRMQPGTMKPAKMPVLALFGVIACQMVFPVVLAPVFLPPLAEFAWNWAELRPFLPINLIASGLLAAGTTILYGRALGPLGNLLRQRETKLLAQVAAEVE
jgi:hypothetical protein